MQAHAKQTDPRVARRARLRRAVAARAALDEPHLLRVSVAKRDGGGAQLKMEVIEAPRLADILARGPVPARTAVVLVAGTARAVDALERNGLVARDLAPENILVDRRRGAVLADHGIPPDLVPMDGTNQDPSDVYRAPEERAGRRRTPRGSVYSLGAILLAGLTGEAPPGQLSAELRRSARDMSPTLESVIARAMAVEPKRRYATATEMGRAAVKALKASERVRRVNETPPRIELAPEPKPAQELETSKPLYRKAAAEGITQAPSERAAAKEAERARRAALAAERQAAKDSQRKRKAAARQQKIEERKKTAAALLEKMAERQAAAAATSKLAAAEHRPAPAERAAAKDAERARPAALSAERHAKDSQRKGKAAARQQKIEEWKQTAAALLEKIEERKQTAAALPEKMAERQRKAAAAAKSKLAAAAEHLRQSAKREETAHSRTRGNIVTRRRAVALAAVGLLATGAVAFALTSGSEPTQSQTPIRNAELSLRMPSGWQRTSPVEGRFGSLSSTLGATPAGAKDTVLQTGLIVEPQDTTQALRRLLPAGGEAVTTHLGGLEVARYAPLRTRAGSTGSAYVLTTTGASVLILCEASGGADPNALRACAQAASTVQLKGERALSPAVGERREEAIRATVRTLLAERAAGRDRLAASLVADDQAAAARSLEVTFLRAAERVDQSGMYGPRVVALSTALRTTSGGYGDLAKSISNGDQPAYDAARADVEHAETQVWAASVAN